ncbi:MAG: hypothetical protein HYT07_00715 [Candidatus Levybacteria bacterium]|nr:hypothetical protein [Candidatus Levybacteria bacterium]
MDNLTITKLKALIDENANIGIAVGKNPGIDEMGAALALYLALSQEGKKVTIASPSEPIVKVSSLVGIDKVKKGFDQDQGDLTVSFPYKEGEIEKISYTLEDGKLNILVKASELGLSFDENNILYSRGGGAPKLVFVVGTPRVSDLGRVFSPQALKDSTIVNIDYRENNQGFGDLVLVSKNLSSVSEMIASLIVSMGLKIDMDVASNLMSGIIMATDNFQSAKTSPLSFEMAAFLMKKGATRQAPDINKKPEILQGDEAYSFFAPPKQPKNDDQKATAFAKKAIEPKDAAFAKDSSEPTEDNPPDDWLAPKIYKGSTTI